MKKLIEKLLNEKPGGIGVQMVVKDWGVVVGALKKHDDMEDLCVVNAVIGQSDDKKPIMQAYILDPSNVVALSVLPEIETKSPLAI